MKTKEILEVRTSVISGCPYCRWNGFSEEFAARVNHFIQAHKFELLHVGTQTGRDDEGKPWHDTVAVLGHNKPPKKLPILSVILKGRRK